MKKSFLQNILDFMSGNKFMDSRTISPKEAVEIQLKYIDSLKSARKTSNYPPYMEITKQLFSDKPEMFKAAVYYLVKIAENESKYTETILDILRECHVKSPHSTENKTYLQEQIDYLEKSTRDII